MGRRESYNETPFETPVAARRPSLKFRMRGGREDRPARHGILYFSLPIIAGAHEQIRTADRLLTMQVLYRLSYVGPSLVRPKRLLISVRSVGAGNGVRTRDPQLGRLMLYQLSYSRIDLFNSQNSLRPAPFTFMRQAAPSGGEGRIRTSEAYRNRFTVCPLWPLGNLPHTTTRAGPGETQVAQTPVPFHIPYILKGRGGGLST